jgi:hypothetical protein
VDHRTLADQGIDRPPRARVPWSTVTRERKGLRSEIGDRVRANHRARVQAKKQRDLDLGSKPKLDSPSRDPSVPGKAGEQERLSPTGVVPKKPSIEDLQRQSREAWLQMRQAAGKAQEGRGPGADRSDDQLPKPPSLDDDHSL